MIIFSLTEVMLHQWFWEPEVEFSSVEWQLPRCPSGNIMVCHYSLNNDCIHCSIQSERFVNCNFILDTIYTERYMNQSSENKFYFVSLQKKADTKDSVRNNFTESTELC